MVDMTRSEYDQMLREAAETNPLIPRPDKLQREESSLPGLASMMIPLELVKMAEVFAAGDMVMGSYMILFLVGTLLVAVYLPAQMRLKEMSRAGTPTQETVMLGKYWWTQHYRIISVVPAAEPMEPLDLAELVARPSDDQIALFGEAMTDEYIQRLIQRYRDEVAGRTRQDRWQRRLQAVRDVLPRLRRWMIAGVVLTVLVYIFHPRLLQLWNMLLAIAGW